MKQALPAHPTAVAALGGMLRDRLSDVLPPRKIAQVELLTSELVTNAVLHARLNEGDPIAIEIEAGPTKVHVSVIDAGIGFNFAKILREPRRRDRRMGLFLVESVADRWGIVDSPPHSVWFETPRAWYESWPPGVRIHGWIARLRTKDGSALWRSSAVS